MIAVLVFFVLHWYFSLFCQTFFLHRYAAHGMFTMNRFWEKCFSLLTFICQGSSYLSPRAYAILHKMHHAFSDTEKDPHSPHNHPNIFTMMWKTKTIYMIYVKEKKDPEGRFESPVFWPKLEKIGDQLFTRIIWALIYIAVYVLLYQLFQFHWAFFLLLPLHFTMGALHGAIVNWCGHKYGYANFDNHDQSKNTLVFDFLMLGELFQNNHHKLPNRFNFAAKWFEIDPVYPILVLFNWLGIIRLKPIKVKA